MARDPHVTLTEEELTSRLQKQEEAALSYLYDHYAPALYGVVLRIVKKEEEAEDVLQEIFIRIWHSIQQYDAGKGRLFTWMINIARHAAIDKIRSKQYRVGSKTQAIEDSGVNQMSSALGVKPDHIGLREMVAKLNPDQKRVIDMMYFEGFTQSEVAEELDIPLGTVKTRARTAIKLLTKLLR